MEELEVEVEVDVEVEVEVEVEVDVAGDQKKTRSAHVLAISKKAAPLQLTPFGELRELKNAAALSAFPVYTAAKICQKPSPYSPLLFGSLDFF